MSQRFQIQDIVTQDLFGIIFHALDVATGRPVEIRRFFPFGLEGGGLIDEERTAYDLTIERLSGLRHAGLRTVLTGGTDPVDGMPFLVSEWVDGESLETLLSRDVFPPEAAIATVIRVMEISHVLSRALGAETVWLETSPALIYHDPKDPDRGLTFSFSPMKWLGGDGKRCSMLPLAELTVNLLGWGGKKVDDHDAGGLGGWVKWVYSHAETLTLELARNALDEFTRPPAPEPEIPPAPEPELPLFNTPPPPFPEPVPVVFDTPPPPFPEPAPVVFDTPPPPFPEPAPVPGPEFHELEPSPHEEHPGASPQEFEPTDPQAQFTAPPQPAANPRPNKRPAKPVLITVGALALTITLLSTVWLVRHPLRKSHKAGPPATTQAGTPTTNATNDGNVLAELVNNPPQGKEIFHISDSQLLLGERRSEVTLEGVLKNVRTTDSNKTLYLEFSLNCPPHEARGFYPLKNGAPDMTETALKPLVGRLIRITGVVKVANTGKHKRPEIQLKDRKSIERMK